MAGHSQFKNIMHRKGRQDAKRAKIFTKIGREIMVAAKTGGGNPDFNPRLRAALIEARANNMPNDRIKKASKKDLTEDFVKDMMEAIHQESIRHQTKIMNNILAE